ncbi:MAG: branched-chain amino acid ABC transporter permease, partial [Proteobacteria bacterium]|nr:branched-chain amino acid ABC transporter permease [Pseudomonadota bacterium]
TVYTVISLGFITIYRTTGVLNIAQGEYFLLGAYAVYLLVIQLGVPFGFGLPLAIALLGILGIMTERFALRPMVGQPILGVILMTLGLSIFLRGIMVLIWSDLIRPMPRIFAARGVDFYGINVPSQYAWFVMISVCIFITLFLFFNRTKMGLIMTAAADDIQLSQSCGVSVNRITAAAWAIACLVTGIGGFLLCTITGIYPEMGMLGLRAIAVVLAGGMESLAGAMIMGPILGAIEFLAAGYLDPYTGGGIRDIVSFSVLIIFLIFRPQGLFGWKIIERV